MRTIAALTLAIAALVAFLTLRSDGPTYEVRAVFDNVNGLVETGEVRVGSFKVGEIADIEMQLGGHPTVTMTIDRDYALRRGATANIRLGSQAGQLNRYVALTNGTGPRLRDGATIGLAHTDQPVEIDDFLSALDRKTRTELRGLLVRTVRSLEGRGPDIERALRHSADAFDETAHVLADLTDDRAALRTLVDRAEDGARAVASEPAEVSATVERLARLLDVTAARESELRDSVALLPGTLSSARGAIGRLDALTPTLQRVIGAADGALGPVDRLVPQLRVSARVAPPAFTSFRKLVESFIYTGPRLRRLFLTSAPVLEDFAATLRRINPMIDHFRTNAPDLLGWVPLLGDVSSNYDANGHGFFVLLERRTPVRRPRTRSDCGSGWLLRPFDRAPGALACEPWKDYDKSFIGGGQRPETFLTPEQRKGFPGEFGK